MTNLSKKRRKMRPKSRLNAAFLSKNCKKIELKADQFYEWSILIGKIHAIANFSVRFVFIETLCFFISISQQQSDFNFKKFFFQKTYTSILTHINLIFHKII